MPTSKPQIVKALFIDPTVRNVFHGPIEVYSGRNDMGKIYEFLGCDVIEPAYCFQTPDVLLVDEEGMIKPKGLGNFRFGADHRLIYGKAIILGYTNDGEWASTHISAEFMKTYVKFAES